MQTEIRPSWLFEELRANRPSRRFTTVSAEVGGGEALAAQGLQLRPPKRSELETSSSTFLTLIRGSSFGGARTKTTFPKTQTRTSTNCKTMFGKCSDNFRHDSASGVPPETRP